MFKPLLACGRAPHMDEIEFYKKIEQHLPLISQPKLDGIRCLINGEGCPVSRTLKPIPNKWITYQLKSLNLPYGFDGELLTVTLPDKKGWDDFNTIQSKVMTEGGTPTFCYVVFDWFGGEEYEKRHKRLSNYIRELGEDKSISSINNVWCLSLGHIKQQLGYYLTEDYEGICLHNPRSRYKQGRSTLNEGILFKLKPYETSEGVIVGFKELQRNANKQTRDALGRMERSSHTINMVPADTLGAFTVKDNAFHETFEVGSGFDDNERSIYWRDREHLMGKIITYKYQANRTTKDKPICPIFKGFRDERDV